jgi:probable RNA-binding protein EIF1AD
MPKPKRHLLATVEDTVTPPETLSPSQAIARVVKATGKNLYNAELPNGTPVLVELEAKFRSTIWIKRGSYVVVDNETLAERENKLDGEIVNVVRDEKAWRKMAYWYDPPMRFYGGIPGIVYRGADTEQAEGVYEEVHVCRR